MLAAGAKLHSVVVHLAAHAHFTYGADAMEEHAEAISAQAEAEDELPSGDLDADVATSKDADTAGGGGIHRQTLMKAMPSAVTQAVPDAVGDALGLNTGPRLKRAGKRQADVTARYRKYAGRVKATDELAHMFWFDRPGLLLWFYKLAYFRECCCPGQVRMQPAHACSPDAWASMRLAAHRPCRHLAARRVGVLHDARVLRLLEGQPVPARPHHARRPADCVPHRAGRERRALVLQRDGGAARLRAGADGRPQRRAGRHQVSRGQLQVRGAAPCDALDDA